LSLSSSLHCILVLALDEIRAILRSRRGRFMTAIYFILNLLPLLLYLWLRSRTVITWPVDAADIALYLRGHRLLDLALVISLAHDLLTRGDREGWQDGFATLPVGELTWLGGRLAGRLVCLLLAISLPWTAGYLLSSAWAGAWLDPLPFAGIMIARQVVSLALLLPLVVMAGCIGGSLVGAFVVLVTVLLTADLLVNLTLTAGLRAGLPAELFGATGTSIIGIFLYESHGSFGESMRLIMALFSEYTRPNFLPWWYGIMFHPDGGRHWTPSAYINLHMRAGLIVAWLLFLSLTPFLLRLRRRAGRLQIRLPSLPTFSQWFGELVDEVRPIQPEGMPVRLLSRCAGLVLVLVLAWGTVAVAELGGRELSLQMPSKKRPVTRPWSTRMALTERRIELTIAPDGLLTGREVLTGVVTGHPNRPFVLALAPGMAVNELSDRRGRQLSWQRDLEQIRIVPHRLGEIELEIAFSGRPQRLHRHKIFPQHMSGTWILNPQIQTPEVSGQRRWMIDLTGLSWAPEPISTVTGEGAFGGREPCLGETRVELRLPGHLVPVPLPGGWRERRTAGLVHASWHGLVPFLPPVVAGALQRTTEGDVTVVCQSAGTDRQAVLRRWRQAWAEYEELPDSGDIVLWLNRVSDRGGRWRRSIRNEPDLSAPQGLVSISSEAEIRTGVESLSMRASVAETRAHIRFFPLLPRLDLVENVIARRLLWTICANLERPKEWRERLDLGNLEENAFRSISLQQPVATGWEANKRLGGKLTTVTTAIINLLGSEQVEAGLHRLAEGHGKLTVDDVWQELAAERVDELTWFRDEVLYGSQVPAPRLSGVASEETDTGWLVHMTLVNDGDAYTVVPLRLICGGDKLTIRVDMPPQQQVTVTRASAQQPEQVVLDPDGIVLRRALRHGNRWRRGQGVR
jgi:hypothetical protein